MKKLSVSLIALILATPSFATGIGASAESASCDNGVLGTYTGPSTLSANWTANTINLDFYDGETKLSSGQCTYDTGITLPSDPEKTGYEFSGWRVRRAAAAPQCDFDVFAYTMKNGKAYGFTRLIDAVGVNEETFGLTQGSGEWAVEFYHGIIKGIARCSTVGSEYTKGQTGTPTDDLDLNNLENGAKYCWCKMTNYDSLWVFDTGDTRSSPIYLTGYTNQSQCKTAIRAITGLNSTNAGTLMNNASNENPQLITNANGANLAYLTDMGCITSGSATGHFENIGNACSVAFSSWVFLSGGDNAADCAVNCAAVCASNVKGNASFSRAVFGITL